MSDTERRQSDEQAGVLEQLRALIAALERRCEALERRLRLVEGYQER